MYYLLLLIYLYALLLNPHLMTQCKASLKVYSNRFVSENASITFHCFSSIIFIIILALYKVCHERGLKSSGKSSFHNREKIVSRVTRATVSIADRSILPLRAFSPGASRQLARLNASRYNISYIPYNTVVISLS